MVLALIVYPLLQAPVPHGSSATPALIHLLPIAVAAFILIKTGLMGWLATLIWSVVATVFLFYSGLPLVLRILVDAMPIGGGLFPAFYGPDLWTIDLSELTQLLAVTVFAVVLGQTMRHLDQTRAELEQRNAELLALQGIEAERAVTAERNRISRDLHDIVAHHVTAIVVRAQAALHIGRTKPEVSREALGWIVDEGKQSLSAMREMVAVLRTDAESADLGESLHKVAERLRGGGLDVRLVIHGSMPRVPGTVHEAALRIAQEALTNVALHSGATSADLDVLVAPGLLTITVTDPGPVVADDGDDPEREGNGLRHMRERAQGVGGRLMTGPLDDGRRVVAQLPIAQRRIGA